MKNEQVSSIGLKGMFMRYFGFNPLFTRVTSWEYQFRDKISYAQLDNISVYSKFMEVAYAESLKETQSQDRHRFILGNPQGEENQTKIPLYRCIR